MTKDELHELFYNNLHWCCGSPEDVLEAICSVLNEAKAFHNNEISSTSCYENGFKQFMWHSLNDAGLLEHGCGVSGSWLTDKGEALLRLIDENGVSKVCDMVEE